MPPPIATGNNNPNYHPTELLFDPRRGMSFRQHVSCGKLTGTAQAQLLAILNQVQGWGASGKMVFSAEKPSLEYELVGVPQNLTGVLSELYFDDWQMQNDDLTNTIFANTILGAGLSYNDRMVLQRYMKLGSATIMSDVVASLNADVAAGILTGTFSAPSSTAYIQQIFKQIDKDQTEFLDPLPVLTHTTVCSPGASYNVTRANEMCIYTPAQLLTEVGSGWTYNLPGALYSQISSFPYRSAPADEAAYYTWGWLKTRATQSTMTNFMVERHQEYKLNLWPNTYYALR